MTTIIVFIMAVAALLSMGLRWHMDDCDFAIPTTRDQKIAKNLIILLGAIGLPVIFLSWLIVKAMIVILDIRHNNV